MPALLDHLSGRLQVCTGAAARIISRGVSGHAVLRNILSHEALDVGHDVGYMFPDRCDAFPLALPCTEIGAYRPLRLDRDTGGPPAMPDWTEWERAFDPNDGGSAVGWHARVRKMHADASDAQVVITCCMLITPSP